MTVRSVITSLVNEGLLYRVQGKGTFVSAPKISAKKVNETLESVSASESEAKLLNIPEGYPLLLLKEINRTAADQAFEYTKIVFRGDMIKIEFDYEL